jgi:ribosomal-protein-alanine N-acetyltransferase
MVGLINIRPMVEADIEAAAAIEAATYPTPWTLGIFRDELGGRGRTYLIAEVDGEPVGYAGLMMVGDEAHVTSVTVHPSRRGERIGTRLMLDMVEAALAGGARSLTLEVRVSNRAAQSLYQRFGMAPVGVRKAYYRDEDALIMWAHDLDGDEYRNRVEALREELA